MVKKLVLVIVISLCTYSVYAQSGKASKKVSVIFDTDMGPDYDDVGAITLLHYFADHGEARILATVASTRYPRVAAVLSVLNTYFQKPDIPVGVPREDASDQADFQKWSDTLVAKYPHKIKSNIDATDAVTLYRKILAKQPDHSVTIITVGFFTNIATLLQSPPDKFSPLTGQALVEKKVLKLVSMAGRFPSGKEFNVDQRVAASKYVFSHFNRPVIFSGFEIGSKIKSGLPLIHNKSIINSPVKDVFRISIPMAKEDTDGRMSWDETAVLAGVKGAAPYFKLQRGSIRINADGSNTWDATKGNHNYLVFARPVKEIQTLINNLMMHQPVK
ncbi:nucleoside hydrolase [Mucilaginibacter sabulilitoris]|uniref:Nucleoside hydrolase n=1 Tax=Mucilaginibacter sabulilitoris TaxID=1173583 RepID=A0ABZ0TFS5_9SPHI|nr:nucleoside hydrolase [Mucilaginibacter sabulilitoris]WPU92036.1 nucleoside hydrolase [Mucilaginibacter sabulilitoris]